MEAEHLDVADQVAKPPVGGQPGAVVDQARRDDPQIAASSAGSAYGRAGAAAAPCAPVSTPARARSPRRARRCRPARAGTAPRRGWCRGRASARPAPAARATWPHSASTATARRPAHGSRAGSASNATDACRSAACSVTSAVTCGLPSRSPPIQLATRRNGASARLRPRGRPPARRRGAGSRRGTSTGSRPARSRSRRRRSACDRRSSLVFHSSRISRRSAFSMSSGGLAPRAASRVDHARWRSRMLFRCTSVGWAVSTGSTRARSKNGDDLARRARARPAAAPAPARSSPSVGWADAARADPRRRSPGDGSN